jgi:C4-dicarboxylate-specific signal transduction histidine kinase/CheY-like chemotaxis protein
MPASRRRLLRTLLIVAAGMLACMLLASHVARQRSLHGESQNVQRQLMLYAQALGQRIDRYRTLPEVLALDPELRAALAHPLAPDEVDRLNRKLEQANGASQSSTLTLIDLGGRALAASNWRDERNNVGVDYSFRPYVQQALARGNGRFYGIGMTTGLPGYFLSEAIRDEHNRITGLIAIKIALQELEREWSQAPDIVLASDRHGVTFLASRDAWRYRLLRPLSRQDAQELEATHQYADQPLRPARYRSTARTGDGGTLALLEDPAEAGPILWLSLPLPDTDWQLHLLHNTQATTVAGRWAATAAAGLWLALALLVLFVRQRQRSRQALILARREAEEANRYKTRFVAAAVHDLLQPLNAARMFSSLLRGHLHDDAGRRVAESLDGALASQDGILNSLLDISRMESGQMEIHVRDFALGPLLQVMHHNFGLIAQSRGLRLTVVDSRYAIRSDEALLRRILQNLLSNAIRYTPSGRVLIGCRRQGEQLRIEVHDQGPGIPESLQREIFEEFRRLDEGHDKDRGAGLGLAIVERLGKLLGHEIGLRSQLGRGSVFWVCVPLARAVPQAAHDAPATVAQQAGQDAPLQGASAWYIDDDAPSCTATAALLQRWGCEVRFAGGPQAALDAAAPQSAPQLVLLDVRMGNFHGPDLYLRLCERWQQSPQLILVTAEHSIALRRQAAEKSWGFLLKPVRPAALRALVSQMLLRRSEDKAS